MVIGGAREVGGICCGLTVDILGYKMLLQARWEGEVEYHNPT